MKEVNVKFEYDNYDVIADGEVYSPGDVREIKLDFVGLSLQELKELDKDFVKEVREQAKLELVTECYEGELRL